MKMMTVGEFKANFSQVIAEVLTGKSVGFTYGKKKKPIGIVSPFTNKTKKTAKRKLGIWEGKMTAKFSKNWKMTDEEFLAS